jgi:hypothetical protein
MKCCVKDMLRILREVKERVTQDEASNTSKRNYFA